MPPEILSSSCSLSPTGTHLPASQLSHTPLLPLSLQLGDRHSSRSPNRCHSLPACVPADCRGWGVEMYLLLQVCTPVAKWLMSCQLFPWAALALLCLCFLFLPCCKCREDGTANSPLGWMEIISVNQLVMPFIPPINKEAALGTILTSFQVKQDLLIQLDVCHFVTKEKQSSQIAWLLGLKLNRKPVTITGRVCIAELTGILWLLIILFLYYIIMCPAVLLQNTLNTSLHHHISLLLNWETITQRLKKWRRIIKGNWGWSWPPFLARLTLKCSHYLVFEGLQQLQAPFS